MKIVKYEIDKNILTVGFGEDNFIVYVQIANDDAKAKQDLLQKAYEQCKPAIDYEKTQEEHAFTWDGIIGEDFVPAPPEARSIALVCDRQYIQFEVEPEAAIVILDAQAADQYGEPYAGAVLYSTDYGTVAGNMLTIPKVTEQREITITANIDSTTDTKKIWAYPYIEPRIVDDDPVDEEKVAIAEAIIDLHARVSALEGGI